MEALSVLMCAHGGNRARSYDASSVKAGGNSHLRLISIKRNISRDHEKTRSHFLCVSAITKG